MAESHEELYGLLVAGRETRFVDPGQVVFNEGDEARGMFILVKGTVTLKHGESLVASVEAPSLFGEMALIDDHPRSLTALAETNVELVHIPARHFWVLVHDTPFFARLVMTVMAERLRAVGQIT